MKRAPVLFLRRQMRSLSRVLLFPARVVSFSRQLSDGLRLSVRQLFSSMICLFFLKFKLVRFCLSHFYQGFGAFKNYIYVSSQCDRSPNTDSCTSVLNLWVRDILVRVVRSSWTGYTPSHKIHILTSSSQSDIQAQPPDQVLV